MQFKLDNNVTILLQITK